ncbi:hypothetical protein NDN08_006364 [Rhodosorus marinus]|uniref:Glycosyl transferase family 25 domain-containing protein n=1 Tax=Rhodosorus marinus TaxID=101924 RepID=A0AAV8UKI8_9RHOD|nr:hypothetical protein NDN08_006364 [Rhodosorus marinus]
MMKSQKLGGFGRFRARRVQAWTVLAAFFVGVLFGGLIIELIFVAQPPEGKPTTAVASFRDVFDKIYIMNMDQCVERWEMTKQYANAIGIDVHRWSAYQAKKEEIMNPPDGISTRNLQHDYIAAGALGNCVSHRRIWKDVIDKGYRRVLVLEDDVFLTNQTWLMLPDLFRLVDEAQEIHKKAWHYIFFRRNAIRNVRDEKVWSMSPSGHPVTIAGPSWGTAAYAVSQAGAQFLHNEYSEFKWPVDVQMAELEKRNRDFVSLSACYNDEFKNMCPENVIEYTKEEKGRCNGSGTQQGGRISKEELNRKYREMDGVEGDQSDE